MSPHSDLEAKYASCPVIKTLEEVGSRWRLTVIHVLREGELRFNELKRATDANSQTLSRVLDDLEETGYVERRVEEESPIAVYYSLTPKGDDLLSAFDEILEWGEKWIDDDDRPDGEESGA
ncbi:transcriptional regulator, HxlR family [Haloterrigena turkmenica DSM 5511]|uniref:Transcriptional regulator, HxlR family n=1 Tax=Haloterrigena turkmenica (strain ATCC 51198 / DSM 5511 / JCM 9101 / NCIMB 13204 / VKM B-1734 / 4k) TaxID=543526 RepID=D2RQ26_HALTV|nr:helix-turn-helix domain-containing protein [Haloterrigena turkmenica]ADB60285.1 transcriptional regulator, HxlR family [Haloterrigena turkmenica DSM 5511]